MAWHDRPRKNEPVWLIRRTQQPNGYVWSIDREMEEATVKFHDGGFETLNFEEFEGCKQMQGGKEGWWIE